MYVIKRDGALMEEQRVSTSERMDVLLNKCREMPFALVLTSSEYHNLEVAKVTEGVGPTSYNGVRILIEP